MKGHIFLLYVLSVILLSCDDAKKDELEGKWQLIEVTAANGTVYLVDTVWYNFQNTLFMYQLYEIDTSTYRRCHGFKARDSENRLLLELNSYPVEPYYIEDFLPYTDWTSAQRTFTIALCTRKELILDSEGKQYRFRKY